MKISSSSAETENVGSIPQIPDHDTMNPVTSSDDDIVLNFDASSDEEDIIMPIEESSDAQNPRSSGSCKSAKLRYKIRKLSSAGTKST